MTAKEVVEYDTEKTEEKSTVCDALSWNLIQKLGHIIVAILTYL